MRTTPDGKNIVPEYVDRAEGANSLRIMIKEPGTGAILYGYRCGRDETAEEAIQKWEAGTYAYHKSR